MSSPFILTIDWLAVTLPSGSVRDTMQVLGGDWTKSEVGFRGYPASWVTASSGRGVCKLGTGAHRSRLEVHVDLSAGIVAPWPSGKVRTVLQWILKQGGHLTRLNCALDDRNSCVPLSTIRQGIEAGQCVTRADRMQSISSSSIHNATIWTSLAGLDSCRLQGEYSPFRGGGSVGSAECTPALSPLRFVIFRHLRTRCRS